MEEKELYLFRVEVKSEALAGAMEDLRQARELAYHAFSKLSEIGALLQEDGSVEQ